MAGAGFGAYDGDESTWGFKATPDGKVILGNTSDDVIQVTGSLNIEGNIYAAEFIYHKGDDDTFVKFTDDVVILKAGGKSMLRGDPTNASGQILINNGGHDLDVLVKNAVTGTLLYTDAGNSRVGIGTGTPISALDVAGKIAITSEVSTPSQPSNGQGYLYAKSDGKIYWRSYDVSETDLTAGGGSGGISWDGSTANGVATYKDADEATVEANLTFDGSTLHVAATDGRVKVEATAGNHPGIEFAEAGTRKWIVYNDPDSDDNLEFKTDSNVRMVIEQDGNVGIGTQTPDYTLDVAGDIGVDQKIYHNGDGDTYINFTDNRIRFDAGGLNLFGMHKKGSAPHQVTVNNGGNNVDFAINDNSSDVYFRADASTSRIGIGTETPSVDLDVNGDVNVSGQFARGVASVNLGSGTTSTLNPGSEGAGTLLVTASSITANETTGVHTCTLADGSVAGQILTIVMVTTCLEGDSGPESMGLLIIGPTNSLNSSYGIVTITGEALGGTPLGATAVLIWTGSAWAILSTRRGGGTA